MTVFASTYLLTVAIEVVTSSTKMSACANSRRTLMRPSRACCALRTMRVPVANLSEHGAAATMMAVRI